MIKAGIAGAAGYTGGELLRLLLRHPGVQVVYAQSRSQHGKPVSAVHQDLAGETALCFSAAMEDAVDVLFLCGGHGTARQLLQEEPIDTSVKIIDLSQDFRLEANCKAGGRTFIYGLPEAGKDSIARASNIANPGCFATALQLGLLPLVADGFSGAVYATGITGATGAGQSLSASSHFSWRANNIQAYKSLQHQHRAEVREQLRTRQPQAVAPQLSFVPWRGDFTRGIFVSQQLHTERDLADLQALYRHFYETHPFTFLSEEPVHLKQVVNTNKCLVQIEQHEGMTVIHTVIDNLLKGAAGQAVQNMNLMYGLDESTGLQLKANYF